MYSVHFFNEIFNIKIDWTFQKTWICKYNEIATFLLWMIASIWKCCRYKSSWKIYLHVEFDGKRSTTKFILYTLPYVCVSVLSLFEQRGRCESRFVSPMKMHKSYYMYIVHSVVAQTNIENVEFLVLVAIQFKQIIQFFQWNDVHDLRIYTCILYFLIYSMVLHNDRVLIWEQLFDQLNCSTNLEVQLFSMSFNFNFHSTISNSSMKWVK